MKIDEIARHAAESVNRIAQDHPVPGIEPVVTSVRRQRLLIGTAAAAFTLLAIGIAVIIPGSQELPPAGSTTLPDSTTTLPVTPSTQPPTSTTLVPSTDLPRHVRVATPDGVINLPGGEVQTGSEAYGAPWYVSIVDDNNGGIYVAYPVEVGEDGIALNSAPFAVTWLPLGEDPVDIYDRSGLVRIHELVDVAGSPSLIVSVSTGTQDGEPLEILGVLDVASGGLTLIAEIGSFEDFTDSVTFSDGLFVVTQINHSSAGMFTVDLNGNVDPKNFPDGQGETHFAVPYVGGTFSPDGSTIAVVYQKWIQDPNGTAGELRVESADLLLLDRDGDELARWRVFNNDFDNAYDQVVAVDYDGRIAMIATNETTSDPTGDRSESSRIYWVDTNSDAQPSSARGYDVHILDMTLATGREPLASQSPQDAERDGVLAEVAALPVGQRVAEIDLAQPGTETIAETAEGTYLVSRMPWGGVSTLGSCAPGTECLYGRDFIAPSEYGEIVLMEEGEIVRAWPLPGYPPRGLLVTDDAVYCVRQGDGALPGSMLCRIDRNTGEAIVRIFPYEGAVFTPEWTPANWVVEDPTPVLFDRVGVSRDGSILVTGWGGAAFVDPDTLELRDACGAADQFGFIKSFDGKSFVYDDAEWLTGEEANQAAIAAGEIEEGDTVPNDYYIRNDSTATRSLRLADDAVVCMASTEFGGVTNQALTVDAFLAEIENLDRNRWITDPLTNGSWVEESGGVVARLVVQYQP